MRKRSVRRLIIVAFIFVLIGTGAYALYKISTNEPPVEEIRKARENISKANVKKADKFAKDDLKKSMALYDSAMVHWERENEKFILFRDYTKVREFANESVRLSSTASQKASSSSDKLKTEVKKELADLKSRIDHFKRNFDKLPGDRIWKQFNAGKLKYEEAKAAYDHGELLEARKKLDTAKPKIDYCYKEATAILEKYFEAYPEWQRISNAAIKQSRSNHNQAIIVDKFARKCYLYSKGELIEIFHVDLGRNWMGSKNHSGDLTTPEGSYKITDKKERSRTKYYKALLLNYPNEEDKKRFQANKKNGIIAKNKSIGGLIEIHGEGGQGADWTEGCVALANKDMDRLYAKTSVGTPVIIVGSLKPLNTLFQ